MKTKDRELISRYLSGDATEDQVRELELRLKESPELRAALIRQSNVDSALEAEFESRDGEAQNGGARYPAFPMRSSRLFQQPWMSAAALLVVGVFVGCLGTGMIWALNGENRLFQFALPIANSGFESESATFALGYPIEEGQWSGDQVEVVESGHQGVASFEGNHMLQLKQSWGKSPGSPHTRANQWQVVDLGESKLGDEAAIAMLRAQFNRIDAGPETDTAFFLQIFAFEGSPSDTEAQFDQDNYVSSARQRYDTDSDSTTWETVEVTTVVPAGTDFLLIGFYSYEDKHDDSPEDLEFLGHYVDGVEVILTQLNSN